MQKHVLRELQEPDIPAVEELESLGNPMPWRAADLHQFVAGSVDSRESGSTPLGRVAFLADTGEIVGYVCATLVGSEAEMLILGVAPEQRRRGLGAALIRDLLRVLDGFGCHNLFLEVRQGNEPAIALYRKVGFAEIAIRKGYYADTGEDAKVMKWTG